MDSSNESQSTHPVLCAKNCGFFGNPDTLNLCSKCYGDYLKEEKAAAKSVEETAEVAKPRVNGGGNEDYNSPSCTAKDINNLPTQKNRCHCCNKRIGLTGFSCRCGGVFCGVHRYPEEHKCKFDFKTQGRSLIAKENPLCKGDKLDYRL